MIAYWDEIMTPRPGLGILEVENKLDNVYIKDQYGRVRQIVIEHEHPIIHLVGRE